MKLTTEQIRQILFGALRIQSQEDGLHFYKCTQRQCNAWYALSRDLGARAELTTPGVRLDFHTSSKHFAINAIGTYEVYVNDLFRTKWDLQAGGRAELALCDPLGEPLEEARVTLVFPSHLDKVALQSVELDDGATLVPHVFDRKILFLGDSITQGWESGWDSLSYAWRVIRFFNADAVIQGVGGAYFHESVIDRIAFDPDWVLVAFGTNDFGKCPTLDAMRTRVAAFMDRLVQEYPTKRIFCLSPIWRAVQEKPMGQFRDCRRVVIEEAEKRGLIHINGLDLVPPDPAFFADAKPLHPNALGFGIYAENLIRALQRYL